MPTGIPKKRTKRSAMEAGIANGVNPHTGNTFAFRQKYGSSTRRAKAGVLEGVEAIKWKPTYFKKHGRWYRTDQHGNTYPSSPPQPAE